MSCTEDNSKKRTNYEARERQSRTRTKAACQIYRATVFGTLGIMCLPYHKPTPKLKKICHVFVATGCVRKTKPILILSLSKLFPSRPQVTWLANYSAFFAVTNPFNSSCRYSGLPIKTILRIDSKLRKS